MRAFDERVPSFDEVGRMVAAQGIGSLAASAGAFLAGAVVGPQGETSAKPKAKK